MPRSFSRGFVPFLMPARRRWREEDARKVLDHLESSGLSVREFAAKAKLSALRLHRWRTRLGAAGPAAPAFVEIKATSGAMIEVVLRSGYVVRIPDGFDEDTFRRLAAVLEG